VITTKMFRRCQKLKPRFFVFNVRSNEPSKRSPSGTSGGGGRQANCQAVSTGSTVILHFTTTYLKSEATIQAYLEALGRYSNQGKYHCTVDLLFDQFRNVPLCSTKLSAPSMMYISILVKQEVNCTVIHPP